jgi:hypothetical protein
MKTPVLTTLAGAAVALLATAMEAHAVPCSSVFCGSHAAPAPLLAAGVPAFIALGGGAVAHRVWRRVTQRS